MSFIGLGAQMPDAEWGDDQYWQKLFADSAVDRGLPSLFPLILFIGVGDGLRKTSQTVLCHPTSIQ